MAALSKRARQLRRKAFFGFEQLEDRKVLAGNVTAIDSSGYLILIGDSGDNQVAITQNAGGGLTLNSAGTGAATTFNGQASFTATNATRGALILLGEGNDSVSLTGTAATPLNWGGSTIINLGNGNNTANLSNFTTAGPLVIASGEGNDTINMAGTAGAAGAAAGIGANIGQNLVINTAGGNDAINIRNTTVGLVTVINEVTGNDTLDVRNSTFNHVAVFVGGPDFDTINNAGNTFTLAGRPFAPIVVQYENQTSINAPTAVNDTVNATVGTTSIVNVLTNDNANGGTLNNGSVVVVTQGANGTAVANANGTISYTPNAGTTATTDTFTYTVADTNGNVSNVGTVNVNINNPPTIAQIANQTTNEDTPITVPITVNDIQTPVGSLIVSAISSTPGLITSLTPNAGNTGLVITPAADQNGTTNVTVTVQDAAGAQTTQTFQLTVTPVNDAPTLTQPANIVSQLGTAIPATTTTVTDIDTPVGTVGVTATSSNTGLIPNAGIVVSGTGASRTITITPTAGATGSSTITLTADDGAGGTTTQTFTVNISAPPTVNLTGVTGSTQDSGEGGTVTTLEDTATSVGLTIAPPEVGETIQSVVITSNNQALFSNASLATAYNAGTNTLNLTPSANASGTATITVVATDSLGISTTRTFNVVVTGVDDPTQNLTQTASLTTTAGGSGSVSGDVTQNSLPPDLASQAAYDFDGALTVTGIRSSPGGTVTPVTAGTGGSLNAGIGTIVMNADGTYTFTADPAVLGLVVAGFPAFPAGSYPVDVYFDMTDGTNVSQGHLTINVIKPA